MSKIQNDRFRNIATDPLATGRGSLWITIAQFGNQYLHVSTSLNLQPGGPLLVGYSRLLIQYIRSYPPCWRPFLHPQPEDAPCRGDTEPLIMALGTTAVKCSSSYLYVSLPQEKMAKNTNSGPPKYKRERV